MLATKYTALKRGLTVGDAQEILDIWPDLIQPASIITSPPYLDMHDYGNNSRIGRRGQNVEDYLSMLYDVFRDCHQIATVDATFWLVAGSVRRNQRLVSLPNKLADCAEQAGWILRESVTWDKQKALPWTHHGELRDITEQAMLFSKADNFRFDATEIRSPIPNSLWWRRYPERYSPSGTMPTNIWSIPIPTQGSWSGVRTHLCPFPEELTYRMLSLTTKKGDVVFDPFAGIGSVPAMAETMGRIGYGIELSEDYVATYENTSKSASRFLKRVNDDENRRENFSRTIIELRLLKFARTLADQINAAGLPITWIRAKKSTRRPRQDHKIVVAKFEIVLGDDSSRKAALAAALEAIQRPPLSKFGVDADLVSTASDRASLAGYWYPSGKFWNAPVSKKPRNIGPHVVAAFRPDPDRVDDTPYA